MNVETMTAADHVEAVRSNGVQPFDGSAKAFASGLSETPLVSVIIPAYNGQETIAEAVQSALAQTYRNLEVIVVDDGSTDDTWKVLQSFGDSIRVIRQPNGGLAAARNAGALAAKGELVALMDADDICEPERIAVQVQFLRARPELVLCCTEFSAFNSNGPIADTYSATYYDRLSPPAGGARSRFPEHSTLDIGNCLAAPPTEPVEVAVFSGPVYEEIALGNFVHPPTVLFRRSVIERAGLFLREAQSNCDWDWLVKAAKVGDFGFISRPLLQYRISGSQMSSKLRQQTDALLVAKSICERDPALHRRRGREFRKLFSSIHAGIGYRELALGNRYSAFKHLSRSFVLSPNLQIAGQLALNCLPYYMHDGIRHAKRNAIKSVDLWEYW